eukprot:TRINITY_DN49381_c0_g1_i1.p1 TRINITY_DN49381_c0_g1~~TRINITY_DN49381_c0_g1_i1.p1  ORF type:complete len:390 (-),score=41.22 TRINITY_DN49381_c0_g1_i1:59-1150(-)
MALCVLCEAAPQLEEAGLAEAEGALDAHLLLPTEENCAWKAWKPVLQTLRVDIRHHHAGGARNEDSTESSFVLPLPRQRKGPVRVLGFLETLKFLRDGGSLARMNDGEQLMMHPEFNAPLPRLTDFVRRLQIAAMAECSGLCIGLMHPDDEASLSGLDAVGETHRQWWTERGFRLTHSAFEAGLFSHERTYCFGLVTYRPKSGPWRMSTKTFAETWDMVFANRSVLLVQPVDAAFYDRCGGCAPRSPLLYGGGQRVPPFRLAKRVHAMNPHLLRYSHVLGSEWASIVQVVRRAVAEARADTVAVVWGPAADVLVAELACHGLRAIDVGNLFSILRGGQAARDVDPDDVRESAEVLPRSQYISL